MAVDFADHPKYHGTKVLTRSHVRYTLLSSLEITSHYKSRLLAATNIFLDDQLEVWHTLKSAEMAIPTTAIAGCHRNQDYDA